MDQQEKEKLARALTKAIAYAENNGKPNIDKPRAGKTGEMASIFQYTPDTWKQYSKEVMKSDNVPMNADNETYVTNEKVKRWIDEGYTAGQIASMWNAGPSKPDAYKQNWKGTNKKYGVKYDTPKYAETVLKYSKQFYNDGETNIDSTGSALTTEKRPTDNSADPLSSVLATMTQASKPVPSIVDNNALSANTGGLLHQALNSR